MKIEVKTHRPYTVTVENGVLNRVGELIRPLKKPGAKVMLISDAHVMPLYGDRVAASYAHY